MSWDRLEVGGGRRLHGAHRSGGGRFESADRAATKEGGCSKALLTPTPVEQLGARLGNSSLYHVDCGGRPSSVRDSISQNIGIGIVAVVLAASAASLASVPRCLKLRCDAWALRLGVVSCASFGGYVRPDFAHILSDGLCTLCRETFIVAVVPHLQSYSGFKSSGNLSSRCPIVF